MSSEITVIKTGSEVICGENDINQSVINDYASGLVNTYGHEGLVVVTSGAVRTGEALVKNMRGANIEDFEEPTLAQIGNVAVMASWQVAFGLQGVLAGEVLTTHREIADLQEGPVLTETLMMAADRGVVSIVNNNDANSRDELESFHSGKDNDRMALDIARLVGASALGIFTSGGGIFDENDQLIDKISDSNYNQVIEMLILRQAEGRGQSLSGKGGIISKTLTAREASLSKMQAFIAAPNSDMTGENVTHFVVG
jgi:glutamate 5-kinase